MTFGMKQSEISIRYELWVINCRWRGFQGANMDKYSHAQLLHLSFEIGK